MRVRRWHLWVFVAALVLLVCGVWLSVQWWVGLVEGVAFFQQRGQTATAQVSDASAALRVLDRSLPVSYRAVDSVRGNVNPDPGSEVLVVGQGTPAASGRYVVFVLDASGQVAYTSSPLLDRPEVLQVRSGEDGRPEFRLVWRSSGAGAASSAAPETLRIRWTGTGFASEASAP